MSETVRFGNMGRHHHHHHHHQTKNAKYRIHRVKIQHRHCHAPAAGNGPLGLELGGGGAAGPIRVVSVQGQAATHGLKKGDQLVALNYSPIPEGTTHAQFVQMVKACT